MSAKESHVLVVINNHGQYWIYGDLCTYCHHERATALLTAASGDFTSKGQFSVWPNSFEINDKYWPVETLGEICLDVARRTYMNSPYKK